MAFEHFDFVWETCVAPGTGSFTLAGAVQGARTFGSVHATGATLYYVATNGTAREVGKGTFTAPSTLARTTILASTNGGSAVNFSSGTISVFEDLPASISKVLERLSWSAGAILSVGDGTVALPAWSFSNDPDCGLYRVGTNNIALAVNGAKVLDIGTGGIVVTGIVNTTGNVTVGAGGTGTSPSLVTVDGGSGTGGGAGVLFAKNSSNKVGIGLHSAITNTGTSNDFVVYSYSFGASAIRVTEATGVTTFGANIVLPGSSSGTATIAAPATGGGTVTLFAGSDTVVGKATTDELTNKTLTTAVGKGTWTASGTWTLPAHTFGGTVSGGGNQLNNVTIGAVTPLAGSFTNVTISGDLIWSATSWTSYTPTITATTGTFTTISATGAYKQIGKTIVGRVQVTITTIGSAAGRMKVPLPVTSVNTAMAVGGGWNTANFKHVSANLHDAQTVASCVLYDGTFPGTTGDGINIFFMYEAS